MDFGITFTEHALQRAAERKISKATLIKAVRFPDKVDVSYKASRRLLFKKVYYNEYLDRDHLLMIAAEKDSKQLKIITIIDTSKISKYF